MVARRPHNAKPGSAGSGAGLHAGLCGQRTRGYAETAGSTTRRAAPPAAGSCPAFRIQPSRWLYSTQNITPLLPHCSQVPWIMYTPESRLNPATLVGQSVCDRFSPHLRHGRLTVSGQLLFHQASVCGSNLSYSSWLSKNSLTFVATVHL